MRPSRTRKALLVIATLGALGATLASPALATTTGTSTTDYPVLEAPPVQMSLGVPAVDNNGSFIAIATTDTTPEMASITTTSAVTVPTVTKVNPVCVSAATRAGMPTGTATSSCTETVSATVSAEESATTADNAEFTRSAATASARPRYCKNWRQWYTTASYHEQHIGRFCYDHVNAYAIRPGWNGYHQCGDSWGLGWSVDNTKCFPVRIDDAKAQGGYFRQQWDWTKLTLLKYVPYSFTRKMHTNIFPSGRVTFHDN